MVREEVAGPVSRSLHAKEPLLRIEPRLFTPRTKFHLSNLLV